MHQTNNFLFQSLNNEQLQAVKHVYGPLLVVAGAGSGKTKALTHRIANLIENHFIDPYNILAVTFGLFVFKSEPLISHEMWLDTTTFRPAVGSEFELSLKNGQMFEGIELSYFKNMFNFIWFKSAQIIIFICIFR